MALANLPKQKKDLEFAKRLGKGFFGEVYRAKEANGEKRIFAVKLIREDLIHQNRLTDQLQREIDLLYNMQHPRIIRLFFDFKEDGSIYLGMEFAAGGSLFDRLNQATKFKPDLASRYFYETCEALDYLHHLSEAVIHRDIKPENVLLDAEDHIKLADFGWANKYLEGDQRDTFCGTLDYLPPEMIMGTGHDTSADMWNMGVLLYELITGQSPFGAPSKEATCRLILNVDLRFPSWVEADAKDLVVALCKKKPAERLKVRAAVAHVFITKFNKTSAPRAPNVVEVNADGRPSVAARKLKDDVGKHEAELQEALGQKKRCEELLADSVTELDQVNSAIQKEKQLRASAVAESKEISERVSANDAEIENLRKKLDLLKVEVEAKTIASGGYPESPQKKHNLFTNPFNKNKR